MLTHRQLARRTSAKWQIGAVVLMVAAGGAAAPPLAKLFSPGEPPKWANNAEPPPVMQNQIGQQNFSGAALTLARLGTPVIAQPSLGDKPPTDVGPGPTEPQVALLPGEWAYVGYLASPTSRSALIKIDSDQRILGVGQEVNSQKVKTIEPTFIEVESAGVVRKIELSQRPSTFPTDLGRRPIAARPMPGQPPMGMTQPMPNNFEQAKQAALEAARRAQMQPSAMPPPRMEKGQTVTPYQDPTAVAKTLSDPSANGRSRINALRAMGITPGMSFEEAVGVMKSAGGDFTEEVLKNSIDLLERNAAGKLNEEEEE